MTASEEIRWEVDGHTIRIGITRLGDGPCVLMLPALSSISTKDELWPLQERLSSEYSTIAVDWPGFGDLPRPKIDWNPNHYRVFLRFLLDTFGSPKACVAAGHGAGYALWLAAEDPGCLGALYVLSPTWRGPLPTMTGKRLGLFDVMAKLGDLPVAGAGLYRANVNRFVVGMMDRGHVYEEPSWFDVCQMQNKLKVIEAEGARHASLRFVCGKLDPFRSRAEVLDAARRSGGNLAVVYSTQSPRKSLVEMIALAGLEGVTPVELRRGKLSFYEEFPDDVANAVKELMLRQGI